MVQITFLKAAVAAASLFTLSNAQVTTSCNPLHTTCSNDKGLASSTYSIDFSAVNSLPSEWTVADYENVTFGVQGAEFTFAKRYDAPTMWTNFKFFFGRVEFVVKAAKGTGIVSSMVLLSDDLDEIDWEFLGGVTSTVQTNYFGKGYTGSYNRSTTPAVDNPQSTFYTYALDWSPTALVWSIDGKAVRTLNAADADGNGSQYPQTPMKISLSLWDAGDPDAATKTWGGGVTPIPPPEPYTMYVKSVKVWNTNPAGQYQYTDNSGSYKSIKIIPDAPTPDSSSSSTSSMPTETLSLGFTASASTAATTEAFSSSSTTMAGSDASSSTEVTSSSSQVPSSSPEPFSSSSTATGPNSGATDSSATSSSSASGSGGAASSSSSNTISSQSMASTSTSIPSTSTASGTSNTVSSATDSAVATSASASKISESTNTPLTTASNGTYSSMATPSCLPGWNNTSSGVNGIPCTGSSVTSYQTVTASSYPSAAIVVNSTVSRIGSLTSSSSFSSEVTTIPTSYSMSSSAAVSTLSLSMMPSANSSGFISSPTSGSFTSTDLAQSPETSEEQTVYSTIEVTITSCHATVMNCPATTSPYVTTSVIPIVPTNTPAPAGLIASSSLVGTSVVATMLTSCSESSSSMTSAPVPATSAIVSSSITSHTAVAGSSVASTPNPSGSASSAVVSTALGTAPAAPLSSLPTTYAYWSSVSTAYSAPAAPSSFSSSVAAIQALSSGSSLSPQPAMSSSQTGNGAFSSIVPDNNDDNDDDTSATATAPPAGTAYTTSSAAVVTSPSPDAAAPSSSSTPNVVQTSIADTQITTTPSSLAASSSANPADSAAIPVAGGIDDGSDSTSTASDTLTMSSTVTASLAATSTSAPISSPDSSDNDEDNSDDNDDDGSDKSDDGVHGSDSDTLSASPPGANTMTMPLYPNLTSVYPVGGNTASTGGVAPTSTGNSNIGTMPVFKGGAERVMPGFSARSSGLGLFVAGLVGGLTLML